MNTNGTPDLNLSVSDIHRELQAVERRRAGMTVGERLQEDLLAETVRKFDYLDLLRPPLMDTVRDPQVQALYERLRDTPMLADVIFTTPSAR